MEIAKYLDFEKELFIIKCLLYLLPAFRGQEVDVYAYIHTHTRKQTMFLSILNERILKLFVQSQVNYHFGVNG